jgi:formate-dependent nitrite reductase membrane component NrfD
MKPYEWMVTYTPQTDWIKGSGAVVWLSFFAGIFGAGAYLASLYFNSFTGALVSWIIVAIIKGGLHVGHAKRPLRLWRMVIKVRTSWIARGTVFTLSLVVFGAVQIILSYRMPGTNLELLFKILTAAAACAVMIYEGFTINCVSGIPFWNSSLLPATLISWGLLNGCAVASVIMPENAGVVPAGRVLIIITIVLTVLYLWNAVYAGATSRESTREIVSAPLFWIGAVLIGMVVPFVVLFAGSAAPVSALIFLASAIIGTLAFSYGVFKAGVYRPLV